LLLSTARNSAGTVGSTPNGLFAALMLTRGRRRHVAVIAILFALLELFALIASLALACMKPPRSEEVIDDTPAELSPTEAQKQA